MPNQLPIASHSSHHGGNIAPVGLGAERSIFHAWKYCSDHLPSGMQAGLCMGGDQGKEVMILCSGARLMGRESWLHHLCLCDLGGDGDVPTSRLREVTSKAHRAVPGMW